MDQTAKPNDAPFPETADIETSSDEYAARFAGPHGAWMLSVQERLALELLGTPGTVLDVGGGHGQLAGPLVRAGWTVTVLGSSPDCAHRLRSLLEAEKARFAVGNVIALPFPDRAFDAVCCFRLVTHCGRWPELVRELCRVAARRVVIDYPTSLSLNAVAPALFGAKKKFEKNTRTWTLFRHAQIAEAFARNGFAVTGRRGQFFFPMVLHRMLKAPRLSAALEAVAGAVGLHRLLGSPVVVRAEPRARA